MRLQTLPLRVFPDPQAYPEAQLSARRVLLLSAAASASVASAPGSYVFSGLHRDRSPSLFALSSTPIEFCWSSLGGFGQRGLGFLLPRGSSVVVHLPVGLPLGLSQPELSLFTDASDSGWGASLGEGHLSGSWSHCSAFSINHRELLAVLYGVQGFLPLLRLRSVSLFADNTTALAYLQNQGGTHSSLLNSVAQAILRLCESHRIRLVPQFILGRLNVMADSLSRRSQVLGSEWTLCFPAFRDLLLLWPATIDLFATSLNHHLPVYFSPMDDPQSAGTDAIMHLGWSPGLRLPSLRPSPARHHEGPAFSAGGAHIGGSLLASASLVPGPSGASGGCPSVPSRSEGSTQTTPLASFSPEPPRASSDCVSYIERSARTFGFSSAVARQLARCHHSSTRVNYQAKWAVSGLRSRKV